MITLYFAPRTRAIRVRWLLEELGLPHELRRVPFQIPTRTFQQQTPLGKLPVIEDGEVTICESGAILEYILERYGEGRLAPPIGSPRRGEFLQWMHFAEATAFAPIGVIVWHTLYKGDADAVPAAIAGARERAFDAFGFVDRALAQRPYLLGDEFSAADIMMGFTIAAAQMLGALDARHANLPPYLARLQARPAFQRSAEL
ncbi:MAG: glutathione S-transferase family protein [Candidatus Binatia bacterium]